MKLTISLVVKLPGKPEHRRELEERLIEMMDSVAQEPDFLSAFLHRSVDEPETLVLYETWACSREHFETHYSAANRRQADERALSALMAAERSVQFLEPVRSWTRRRR
jgi:quinol monooxygenase YgiN